MEGSLTSAVGQDFGRFLGGFQACFRNRPAFDNFMAYCRGLTSNLRRKSVEPIAFHAGKGVRALQCFLTQGHWDHKRLRDQLQQHVADRYVPIPGETRDETDLCVGLIDETSDVKDGHKTPGVQRQYLGCVGKTDNGIVTVHLGLRRGDFGTLLDADLFLPESWARDPGRCREVGIPEDVEYRTKPQIALEQLDRAYANGLSFDFLTFDEGYGRSNPFLDGLERRGQLYVAEVPCNFRCYGRRPKYNSLQGPFGTKEARNLCSHSPIFARQSWHTYRVPRETCEPAQWRVKRGRILRRQEDGSPTSRAYWLIVAYNVTTEEWKYFLSNAPASTPLKTLMRVAFSRWDIERQFRVAKSELGFFDYEGQNYTGLLRHMILCILVMLFATERKAREVDFSP